MTLVEISVENQTEPEIIRKFKDKVGFFLKAFFADDTFNENDWGVTPEALRLDLRTGLETTYFGKTAPVIMMEPFFGHPEPDEEKGELMLNLQEPFRVGNFIDVGISPSGRAFFVAEITNKHAQELLDKKEIIFISPSIKAIEHIHIGGREIITKFRVNHAALVKNPAFGFKAQIRGICKGKGGDCLTSFQDLNASRNYQGAINSSEFTFSENETERIIVYNTQRDSKVDDEICKPLNGKTFDAAFNVFPRIPEDTHPNCRCFYTQQSSGKVVSDLSSNFQAKSKNDGVDSKSMEGKKGAVKLGENFTIAVCENTGNMVIELKAQSPLQKMVSECLSKKLKPGETPTEKDLAICFSEAREKLGKAESLKTKPSNPKSKSKMSGQTEEEKMEEQIAQMDDDEKKKMLLEALKAKAKSAQGKEHPDETEDEKKARKAQEEEEKEKMEANKRAKANEDEIDKLKEDQAELKSTIDEEIKEPIADKIATYKVSVNKIKAENKQAEIKKLMAKSVPVLKELESDYSAIEDFKKNSLNDVPPGYQPRYGDEFSGSLKEDEGKDMLSQIRGRMGART